MIQVRLTDGRSFLLEPELTMKLSFAHGDEVEEHEFKVEDIAELRCPEAEIVGVSGRNAHGTMVRALAFDDPSGVRVVSPPMDEQMTDLLCEQLGHRKIQTFTTMPKDPL